MVSSPHILLFFLVYNTFDMINAKNEFEVLSFCKSNGMKYVTVIDLEKTKTYPFMKIAAKYDISTRTFSHFNIELDPIDCLIINRPNTDQMTTALSLISKHKVLHSVMVFDNFQHFKSLASNHQTNSLFYLYTEDSKWKQVLILENNPKIVINNIEFDALGRAMLNENLQQLHLVPTTLSWDPYVKISNCNSTGRNCGYEGMLVDYMNVWSKNLNFSWDLQEDIRKSWGMEPRSGKHISRTLLSRKIQPKVNKPISKNPFILQILANISSILK